MLENMLPSACVQSCGGAGSFGDLFSCGDSQQTLQNGCPDMLFIDISEDAEGAIALAGRLAEIPGAPWIVFMSDDSSRAMDAFRIHIQGYLVRPVTEEALKSECGCCMARRGISRMFIRTFGNFEIRIDGVPVTLKRAKTRELIAYLIDRNGSMVDDTELLRALWGKNDAASKSYLRMLKVEALKIFDEAGCGNAVVKQRGYMGICTDVVPCDYFDALRSQDPEGSGYSGEYMSQYAWAARTRAALSRMAGIEPAADHERASGADTAEVPADPPAAPAITPAAPAAAPALPAITSAVT